jgi:Flp pilus assembly protein TadD
VREARAAGTAAALLLAAAVAASGDGGLEDALRRQDELAGRGEVARAVAEARERVGKDGKSPEARYLLGRILGNAGNLEEARVQFEGALDLDMQYAPAWRGMATLHMKQGGGLLAASRGAGDGAAGKREEGLRLFETAAREARRAFEIDSGKESLFLLVSILHGKGDRPGAYALLLEELARKPGDNAVRGFYGSLLLEEGNYREAERELRQVLAGVPDDSQARNGLLGVLVATGRLDDAVAECREGGKRAPKDPRWRVILRDLLVRKGDYAGAAAAVREFLGMEIAEAERRRAELDLEQLLRAAAAPRPEGPPDPEAILRDLESADPAVRRRAMETLAGLRLNRVPLAILRRITDPDPEVRLHLVRLLGRQRDPRTAGLLSVLLFHERDREKVPAVRVAAVRTLGEFQAPEVLPLLVRALGEPGPGEMEAAVLGIFRVTGKSLVEDPGAPVPPEGRAELAERYRAWWMESPTGRFWRRKAAEGVGRTGMRSLGEDVVPWLADDDPAMRAAVLACMAGLTGDDAWKHVATATPEERLAVREKALRALAEEPAGEERR